MTNTLYASFTDPSAAERAVGALLDRGVRAEDITVVSNDRRFDQPNVRYMDPALGEMPRDPMTGEVRGSFDGPSMMDSTTRNPTMYNETTIREGVDAPIDVETTDEIEKAGKSGITTTSGADAGAGAVKGAEVGLGLGTVAALASLFVPGIGFVVGGGALALAIAGAVATAGAGAAAGAVTGYLVDQGVDEHVAAHYNRAIAGGGAVIEVWVPSNDVIESEARQILDKYSADKIETFATKRYLA